MDLETNCQRVEGMLLCCGCTYKEGIIICEEVIKRLKKKDAIVNGKDE